MKIEPKQVIENRYEIIEKLGEGGMGEVWKALDTNLGDEVVIKMPLNHLDEDILRRFEREARSMRKHSLECPQILNIEDIGNLDGTPWYVMRYLGGGTVCGRALSKNEDGSVHWDAGTFDWLSKIASALDYLHKENCFHRDVKPENILFSSEGTPYLVDFGIVKTMSETTSMMTDQGKTVGTMAYMAPEILDGGKFTRRSDQYSLAVTLYEFLTGERPFSGTTFFALFRSIQQGHRELCELHPAIPLAASKVVDQALSSEPEQRFHSCSEFTNLFLAGLQTEGDVQLPNDVENEEETRELDVDEYRRLAEEKSAQNEDNNPVRGKPEVLHAEGQSTNRFNVPVAKPELEGKQVEQKPKTRLLFLVVGLLALISGIGVAYTNGVLDSLISKQEKRAETPSTKIASGSSSSFDSGSTKIASGSSSNFDDEPEVAVAVAKSPEELFEEASDLFDSSNRSSSDIRVAVQQFKEAALEGHLQSQKQLGKIYSEGDGVEQDYSEAFDWLRLAAGQDDAESQFAVGVSYAKGDIGVEKDSKEAVHWLKKSAEQDFAEAQTALGMHYFRGEGVEKDLNESKSYLAKAIANDFAPAKVGLELVEAEIEANKPKPLTKLEKLELAATEGDARSQYELAVAHEKGKLGLRKNSKTAMKFFMKAAENDHLPSQQLLAKRYDEGTKPLSPSYDDAEKWYRRAAKQGDTRAKNACQN